MRAGLLTARSEGVSAVVGVGRNIPGGGEETGDGVNDKIGDGVRGGVGRGTERGRGKRGGVSGSDQVKWIGIEQGGEQTSDQLRKKTGREHGRGGKK